MNDLRKFSIHLYLLQWIIRVSAPQDMVSGKVERIRIEPIANKLPYGAPLDNAPIRYRMSCIFRPRLCKCNDNAVPLSPLLMKKNCNWIGP